MWFTVEWNCVLVIRQWIVRYQALCMRGYSIEWQKCDVMRNVDIAFQLQWTGELGIRSDLGTTPLNKAYNAEWCHLKEWLRSDRGNIIWKLDILLLFPALKQGGKRSLAISGEEGSFFNFAHDTAEKQMRRHHSKERKMHKQKGQFRCWRRWS